MSIRRSPPPAPNCPRRASKEQFAQLEFAEPARVYEVTIVELAVGGAVIEFAGLAPSERCVGDAVDVFIDVGSDIEGERVAGTIRADLIYLQVAEDDTRARSLLMWSGADPQAAMVVTRLLTQQVAGAWNFAAQIRVA